MTRPVRLLLPSLIAVLAAAAAPTVLAAEAATLGHSSFYAGLGGAEVTPGNESAARVFAGWQFHPLVALEANYANVQTQKRTIATEAVDVSLLVRTPDLNRVRAFVAGGYAHTKTDVEGVGSNWQNTGTFGGGVQVTVWENLDLRVQWQRLSKYSHIAEDVDFTSASVVLRF